MNIFRHSTLTNQNLETGIAYGYISANSLHPDIVNDLQMNGDEPHYKEQLKAYLDEKREEHEEKQEEARIAHAERGGDGTFEEEDFDEDEHTQKFNDDWQPDEPIYEGEKDGVKYRTSWLGGALNVWIFFSPHVGKFRPCSPCVPGAADCDSPDPDGIEGYTVPPEWLDDDSR